MEALLTKSHDMDDIRFRCCDIMSTIFSIVQDLPQLRPCFPAVKHHTKWILEIDQGNRLGELMKASRGLLIAYINLSINAWDQSAFNNLQDKMDDFTYLIWDLSNTPDIHNFLSLSIQITSHYHIIQERIKAMTYKPFMQASFEAKSIYPWRYTWNRYSMEFLEYLNQCGKIRLGQEYAMYELLEIIRDIIQHKKDDHHMSNEIIGLEFSFFLNTPIEELNVMDTNTFIYPLLFHLLSKSYEELWMDKHKAAWPTGRELKRTHTQLLYSTKYPPCTLREIETSPHLPEKVPLYSDLPEGPEAMDNSDEVPSPPALPVSPEVLELPDDPDDQVEITTVAKILIELTASQTEQLTTNQTTQPEPQ
jgi:hypothetical protein